MKVYIKAMPNGFPETETEYTAWQGFQALGYHTYFYQKDSELEGCRRDEIIVGGISTIRRKMADWGISLPEYNYPPELEQYLGREVLLDDLGSVLSDKSKWPVFVKPVKNKVFVGFVLGCENDIPKLREAKKDEPVLCSTPIGFCSEWRAFVRYGKVCDVRPYRGDWRYPYSTEILEQAVLAFRDCPAGYAADFGVTEDSRTLLIEINDGYSLGCYGMEPVEYAKLLSARWCELVGINDDCDLFYERVDWKKQKKRFDIKGSEKHDQNESLYTCN